ncbi:ABC transporter ATP-binding protein [Pseudalkalibacillus hwajinpoensis]|uniref:ABC transporter ATP-binding protein n=2 Tax=Guptibacillus hwajinpoensis TaxID=208199 RepID=A0A4U1MPM5_9BACL|nr:ABC transporter ATP-binding protein [Pseudalkalibacillus hwajinpoensis]
MEIGRGEMAALIGESGSGKSLTARAILGILPDEMKVNGQILYKGRDLLKLSENEHRLLLGKEIGIIFQDYRGSFTPYIKIGQQMIETIRTHQRISKKAAKEAALLVLRETGLESERVYNSYPFQLSGGQVQRAAISMTLALRPNMLICDEVTTALDLMNGEKVLKYIDKARRETDCAVMMITHDLAQAYKWSDRMHVMYQGAIVEDGPTEQIRFHHQHPYTRKLCSSLLSLPKERKASSAEGVYSI